MEVNFGGKNGTYMFNLEDFILKLCQLAQEVGKDERALHLRSIGLQALSYMVLLLVLVLPLFSGNCLILVPFP
ncbi:hypothetical protein AHAS_Ahas05G0287700 [Arachis hypogaea]